MKTYIYEAKTLEDAINKALTELNIAEDNLIIKSKEEKQGLLKKSAKIEVINANEIVDYLKESLNKILNLIGIPSYNISISISSISIFIFSVIEKNNYST